MRVIADRPHRSDIQRKQHEQDIRVDVTQHRLERRAAVVVRPIVSAAETHPCRLVSDGGDPLLGPIRRDRDRPPGAGYMHLLFMLLTSGSPSEHQREVAGENRFVRGGFGTDFTNAEITLRLKGDLLARDTQLLLLCQGVHHGICTGWLLTGQPITVTSDWSEQRITAVADESAWMCLGSRHDRSDYYGRTPLKTVLSDVNADILFVLFPLDVAPMGPIGDAPHRLRPERDYPVWRSRLPEGYVMLDEIRIQFPGASS